MIEKGLGDFEMAILGILVTLRLNYSYKNTFAIGLFLRIDISESFISTEIFSFRFYSIVIWVLYRKSIINKEHYNIKIFRRGNICVERNFLIIQ